MIELFRRANTGSFRIESGIADGKSVASIVDGSLYSLDSAQTASALFVKRQATSVMSVFVAGLLDGDHQSSSGVERTAHSRDRASYLF